jgi:hypothetical protein
MPHTIAARPIAISNAPSNFIVLVPQTLADRNGRTSTANLSSVAAVSAEKGTASTEVA